MAYRGCALLFGRRMRAAFPSSAISTPGTGAATRCGCVMRRASGSSSSPDLPLAPSINMSCPAPFRWSDDSWCAERARRQAPDAPISIYEVHAGSWRRHSDERSLGWAELAERLVDYVAQMGFTHVEFLPVMGHPFGGSWGYQPLSQFAPHALFGTPEEFALLIDRCHNAGIGVLLDWVPAHFPTDAHGLARFDGTPLYEHADPREGYQQDWNKIGRAHV